MGLDVKDGPPSFEDVQAVFGDLREHLEETTAPGFIVPKDPLDIPSLLEAFSQPLDNGYGYLSPEIELTDDDIEIIENDIEVSTEG